MVFTATGYERGHAGGVSESSGSARLSTGPMPGDTLEASEVGVEGNHLRAVLQRERGQVRVAHQVRRGAVRIEKPVQQGEVSLGGVDRNRRRLCEPELRDSNRFGERQGTIE